MELGYVPIFWGLPSNKQSYLRLLAITYRVQSVAYSSIDRPFKHLYGLLPKCYLLYLPHSGAFAKCWEACPKLSPSNAMYGVLWGSIQALSVYLPGQKLRKVNCYRQ